MSPTGTYLADLDAALAGPRRARRDLVAEAAGHLDDAVAAYERAGWDAEQAERRAVADFGPLDVVVPAFQTTLAVAAARRTAWLLLVALGVQPFLWDGPVSVAGTDGRAPDGVLYPVLDVAVEVVGGAMILATVALLAAATIGNRWHRAGRGVARATSLVTIVAAVTMSATGLAMSVLAQGLHPAYWATVTGFLFAPMAVAAWSGRRTLATC
ncbi:permease prefix domain 1-containing protein [Nocardioides sp. TF02-7]|uniref:permease prefix domain 1-containing protein n=1 Tax=Nocardioides sp. TF02-7 TaxID=2917724 RepID=UPI001F058D5F|nr:permease prefix domain 1-containing protein [Nocardioides sp. TF02-7]UMG92681.1 permease prefix domain 1-containing protein [Nocardioides sp. TF02-7]